MPKIEPGSPRSATGTGAQIETPARLREVFAPIAGRAADQDGLITTPQLHELGLTSARVSRFAAAGLLHRIHRGVYAVGHPDLTERGWLRAAVLQCRRSCALSHSSAAWLWELAPARRPIHLTRGAGGGTRPRGTQIHQCRDFAAVPTTIRRGLPVTTVAQTLFDLAADLPLGQLEDIAARAHRRRLLDRRELENVAGANARRDGVRRFRVLLKRTDPDALEARSWMERQMLRLCRKARVKPPQIGAIVAGWEVDLLWPEEKVIVELDGMAYHSDSTAFEKDRRRDARHMRAGYRTFRVTYRMLTYHPREVLDHLAFLLANR